MTFLYFFTIFLFVLLAALLIFVVLIQEGKSSGLTSMALSSDAGNSLFGTSTADVLKKFTAWLAALFFAMCLLLSLWSASIGASHQAKPSMTIQEQALE